MKKFKQYVIPTGIILVLTSGLIFINSCRKPDSEILGCVHGSAQGEGGTVSLGCMTRVEFDRYLESPNQTWLNTAKSIDRDLTFTKTDDCIKCN